MIILDKPYVSNLLVNTIVTEAIPVLKNEIAKQYNIPKELLINDQKAVSNYSDSNFPPIYSNSENSIGWIAQNLKNTILPETIEVFKNKFLFRNLLKELYPSYYFSKVDFSEIDNCDFKKLPKPFIIKPAVGFFSMGVYLVNSESDWVHAKKSIKHEILNLQGLYPKEVMDEDTFIIEELIQGEEFAFDVYFNSDGKPIIVGILKHLFSSQADTSDRVYYTSKEIIEEYLALFTDFSNEIGKRTQLRNFPMHVEVRVDDKKQIKPIEVNPLRFGGWCTTADLTTMAFGVNPYKCFFKQLEPEWLNVLKGKDGLRYCLMVLENSTGINTDSILEFDYKKLEMQFAKPIEIRKIDWKEYPVFGFAFTETKSTGWNEIEAILKSDLREFVTKK